MHEDDGVHGDRSGAPDASRFRGVQSIQQLQDAFRAGSDRPSHATERALAAADDPDAHVFTEVLHRQARAEAAEADDRWAAGSSVGSLDGVPVAVKDLLHVAGTVPTLGSEVHPEDPS
ncbi:hypothetical protein B7486_66045, partial [cyanobacterium TDX16]